MLIRLDRGDYWQCAYLVRKGGYAALEAAGSESFRADLARLLLDDAPLAALRSWDHVRVLSVRVDRMTRWHQPGLLFTGDAAHAMSPIGGVGINLAVQDAAATAPPHRDRSTVEPSGSDVDHRLRMAPARPTGAADALAIIATEGAGRRRPARHHSDILLMTSTLED
jgi:2-polyprenyl-6-methoxyphenol hydroxylase-like FAD-dependent oxidoreductase